MKTFYLCIGFFICIQVHGQIRTINPSLPMTPKVPVVDTYFGKKVTDNHRWMEDMSSQTTKDWFKAQGNYTNFILDQIPGRDSLINTFIQYDALRPLRYSGMVSRQNEQGIRLYFYRKTLASENISRIFYRKGKAGKETLLFDPVTYDRNKKYAVSGFTPSENGQYIAIGIAQGGLEISTVRILDITTQKFLPESIANVYGGEVTWTPDSKGFVYTPCNSADPTDIKALLDTKAKYHVLTTSSNQDIELMSRIKNPDLKIQPQEIPYLYFTEDFRHIIASLSTVDRRMDAWIAPATDLLKDDIKWRHLITKEDSVYQLATVDGQMFFHSVKGSINGRILAAPAIDPDLKKAVVAVSEDDHIIYNITPSKDFLLITKDDIVRSHFQKYQVATKQIQEIKQPVSGIGYVWSTDPNANDCMMNVTSWTQPSTFYDYDLEKNESSESPFQVAASYPGTENLMVEEIEIESHDGVMVPLSLIYKKGLKKDSSNVCYITGYGAYGVSAVPHFDPKILALLNRNVIIAQTHVRGGSEKGLSWYKAGYKKTKPNTWKDFIASADWLVKNGYTAPMKLIGSGTSAGGIMIGRAITERPDLFAAAINNVGATNILRMEASLNGPGNTPEFGTVKYSTECMALLEMDAYLHVEPGIKYPAVLNVAGINDPRVIVWQPGKFAAALQDASKSGKPVLMQVNYDNGHFTEDKKVDFRNFANMYAFGLWQAGHPDFQKPAPIPKNGQQKALTSKKRTKSVLK